MLDTFKSATSEALQDIREEMEVRRTREVFLLFAMGSQFDHLIYQALCELGFYCLVADPASVTAQDVVVLAPTGIIISGGPASVETEPPPFDKDIFDLRTPVLGICLGFQMWAKHIGVRVSPGSEFGMHRMRIVHAGILLHGCDTGMQVLQSHGERVAFNDRLTALGETNGILAAASSGHLYGVQFHPEVSDTPQSRRIFENFCSGICGAQDRFPARSIATQKIKELRQKIAGKKIVLALSGGSDSSTVAHLLNFELRNSPLDGMIRTIGCLNNEGSTRLFV